MVAGRKRKEKKKEEMKLFIDTANLHEIEEASKWPFVSGVTTNPSLIAKEGLTQKEVIERIAKMIDGPISAEVTEETAEGMLAQAHELYQIKPENIVIKLPMTIEGLKACKKLYEANIPTNVTLCFSPAQALLAMESHATYISPFLGRLDDNGWNGITLLEDIVDIKRNFGYESKIIAASVRSVDHVQQAAIAGVDVATIPYKVLAKLIEHPLTAAGLETFRKDAAKTASLKK